jgi:superfamily II DNA or RNA helicase
MEEKDKRTNFKLSASERLLLNQLLTIEYLEEEEVKDHTVNLKKAKNSQTLSLPDKWKLTKGVELYDWQKQAIGKWFAEGKRGTFKIVTGGGKTILALAAAEKLQNAEVNDLRVAIIVPTIVLLEQWYRELIERSNIPKDNIGRLGGDYHDNFEDSKRILICVLNSASKKLPNMVREAGIESKLMLIVDECHRAGATEMRHVFETKSAFRMGLSATPEREDEIDEQGVWLDYDDSLLGKELGKVLMDLTYEDALNYGLIPPFNIKHYGLPLTPKEQFEYDNLTRSIKDAKLELQNYLSRDKYRNQAFYQWAQRMAQADKGEVSQLAMKFVGDVARRKMLLYRIENRKKAVSLLIKRELSANPNARILLFHESIDEANYLFSLLKNENFPVVLEHSELPDNLRLSNIDMFRQGIAKILVSVKSLIEGFNVPAADVGIIVASSTAVRQRIQSMGRVMRAYKDSSSREKKSTIHILYARNTVDEEIYAKFDWEKLTGANRNFYYFWDIEKEPVETGKPPKLPPPSEIEITENDLRPGDPYPGEYEGLEYTVDTSFNIKDDKGNYIEGFEELAHDIIRLKGSAGRFKITPKKKYVLVQKKIDDDWSTIFVKKLDEIPLAAKMAQMDLLRKPSEAEINSWLETSAPGSSYPFTQVPLLKSDLIFSSKKGGIIVKKTKNGELFVHAGNKANDPNKGSEAESLIQVIKELNSRGEKIVKLELNELNHLLYIKNGQQFFIKKLNYGLEFHE